MKRDNQSIDIYQDTGILWICKACGKEYPSNSILRHLRRKICRDKFTAFEIKELENRSDEKRKRKKTFYNKQRHTKINDDEDLWTCKVCGGRYAKQSIRRHLR